MNRLLPIVLLASLLIGVALLSACVAPAAPADSGEAVAEPAVESGEEGDEATITWLRLAEWNAASPTIIEAFEASHPGIKVEVEEIPFSELVSQINLRFGADDTSIDVLAADVPLVSSYGYRDWLLPLDDFFTEEEKADCLPAALMLAPIRGTCWLHR